MRVLLLSLLTLVVACKQSKEDRCAKIRDQAVPIQERNVREASEAVSPEQKAELVAEGNKEIARFKERFVGICKAVDDQTMTCLEATLATQHGEETKDCKDKLKVVWRQIYEADGD